MEFYANNEVDDESYGSYASDGTSESGFEFDFDKLVDNSDKLELSDEDSCIYAEKMNESYITDGGFTSISRKERTSVSVFRIFFTE